MMTRALAILFTLAISAGPLFAQPPAQAPKAQNEFVPVDQLPPSDQLPSAPLLIVAYAFVWLATLFYMWTIWRRLTKVEGEMRVLEQRRAASARK